MLEGVAAVVLEILLPVAIGIIEFSLALLWASIRPWRYVLSADFRARTNATFVDRSPWVKW